MKTEVTETAEESAVAPGDRVDEEEDADLTPKNLSLKQVEEVP